MTFKLPDVSPDVPRCEFKVMNSGYYYSAKIALLETWDLETIWGPALFFLI